MSILAGHPTPQQIQPGYPEAGGVAVCPSHASSWIRKKRPVRRRINHRPDCQEPTPDPSMPMARVQGHDERYLTDAAAAPNVSEHNQSQLCVDSTPAVDRTLAASPAQAVSPSTGAEHAPEPARPRKLVDLRKDSANCCRCGMPNNNGKRTCDRCREEQHVHNLKRKVKPVAAVCGRYLDVPGAAAHLGLTPNAIYELVASRKIPHMRRGKKRLVFDREELDGYMHGLRSVDVDEAVSRTLHGGTLKAA